MTSPTYCPVIKGKFNDLFALGRISHHSRSSVKPLIEILPVHKAANVETHIFKFARNVTHLVPFGSIFVDLYGLRPGLALTSGVDATIAGFGLLKGLGRALTPIYGFGRDDALWSSLREVVETCAQGFCFRVDIDDLDDQAEETWAQILERSAELGVKPQDTDLMIDLRDVEAGSLDHLQNLVTDFLAWKPSGTSYRTTIICGSSALKTVADVPRDGSIDVVRKELLLWTRLQRDRSDSQLVFSDYGVIHPDFSDQGGIANMNAKIRYTNRGRIRYFRGHGLLKPVKDFEQYHSLARRVQDGDGYCGSEFSYGDRYISEVARRSVKPGTPGTWVLADMNHHIEYVVSQMATLIPKLQTSVDESELEELV